MWTFERYQKYQPLPPVSLLVPPPSPGFPRCTLSLPNLWLKHFLIIFSSYFDVNHHIYHIFMCTNSLPDLKFETYEIWDSLFQKKIADHHSLMCTSLIHVQCTLCTLSPRSGNWTKFSFSRHLDFTLHWSSQYNCVKHLIMFDNDCYAVNVLAWLSKVLLPLKLL